MYIKKKSLLRQLFTGIIAICATCCQLYAQPKAAVPAGWADVTHKASVEMKFVCLLSFRDDEVELPIDFTTDTFLQNRFVSTWVKGYNNIPASLRNKIAADSQYEWNIYLFSPGAKVLKTIHGPAQTGYVYVSLEDAQNDEANRIVLLEELYKGGRRDTAFLKRFFNGNKILGSIPGESLLSSYCRAIAQYGQTDTSLFPLIQKYVMDIQSDAYNYVLDKRPFLIKKYGQEAVDQYIGGTALTAATKDKASDKDLNKAMNAIKTTGLADFTMRLYLADMKYYYRHKRPEDMIKCMDTMIVLHKPETEYYEEVAYGIYLVSHKPEHLRKAEGYILQSLNVERTPLNTLIYAKILYAMGRNEDAQIFNVASQNLAAGAHYKAGQTDRMLQSCTAKLK